MHIAREMTDVSGDAALLIVQAKEKIVITQLRKRLLSVSFRFTKFVNGSREGLIVEGHDES